MKAEIKSVDLIDFENWHFHPDDARNFCVASEALIGPEGETGAEIFSFQICTPKWLEQHTALEGSFLRHILLVDAYDETVIKQAIADLVSGV